MYHVFCVMIRLRFQKLMMFRLGFFGPFFVDGSLFAVQLLVFQAVYSRIDRIGGWGKGEMIIYIGSFSLLNAVNMVIYFFGTISIPYKIKSGEMDLYLTKPVSPLFRISLEQINPGAVPLVIMSLCMIGYGIRQAGLALSVSGAAAYCFWLLLMQILYYEMEVIIRSASFFLVSTARMERLEEAGLELCMQLPGIAFYGIYKVVFCVFLPYGIMATIPVQSLIGEINMRIAAHGLLVIAAFTGITGIVWRQGIRHYHSCGM